MEEWKDIDGYGGMYQVSDAGRVRSWRAYGGKGKTERSYAYRILKPSKTSNGYYNVILTDNNNNEKHHLIHRLVASAFIENKDNKPHVNHINGDKYDNGANNLEWITPKENNNHALDNGLRNRTPRARKTMRSDGVVFNSALEAGRAMGFKNGSHVSDVCNGSRSTCGGYGFKYID